MNSHNAAIHALTLLKLGHTKVALELSRVFSLTYLDIVLASESMGNTERKAKAHGLFLVGLGSLEAIK